MFPSIGAPVTSTEIRLVSSSKFNTKCSSVSHLHDKFLYCLINSFFRRGLVGVNKLIYIRGYIFLVDRFLSSLVRDHTLKHHTATFTNSILDMNLLRMNAPSNIIMLNYY